MVLLPCTIFFSFFLRNEFGDFSGVTITFFAIVWAFGKYHALFTWPVLSNKMILRPKWCLKKMAIKRQHQRENILLDLCYNGACCE